MLWERGPWGSSHECTFGESGSAFGKSCSFWRVRYCEKKHEQTHAMATCRELSGDDLARESEGLGEESDY